MYKYTLKNKKILWISLNQSKNHASNKGKIAGRYQFDTHPTGIGLLQNRSKKFSDPLWISANQINGSWDARGRGTCFVCGFKWSSFRMNQWESRLRGSQPITSRETYARKIVVEESAKVKISQSGDTSDRNPEMVLLAPSTIYYTTYYNQSNSLAQLEILCQE